MKTINEIKAEKTKKVDQLITDSLMFFAFSNEQFVESKTTKRDNENYVSLGAGAYMPKHKVEMYKAGIDSINKWYKEAIAANKLRMANIKYELVNHEAGYTGEIEDTMCALGEGYTEAEVRTVLYSL